MMRQPNARVNYSQHGNEGKENKLLPLQLIVDNIEKGYPLTYFDIPHGINPIMQIDGILAQSLIKPETLSAIASITQDVNFQLQCDPETGFVASPGNPTPPKQNDHGPASHGIGE